VRFDEIADSGRRVVATKRFLKNIREFTRIYPDVGQTLAEFLRFRETAPASQGFSKKDAPFTGGQLVGFRHVHLRFGKVILVYQLVGNEIRLIDVVDHKTADSDNFSRFVVGVKAGEYMDMSGAGAAETVQKPQVSGEALDEIKEFLLAFAGDATDRALLVQTYEGQYAPEVWDVLRSVIPGDAPDSQKDRAITTAFGGTKKFRDVVFAVLQQTNRR
jgi:hypothetical protein